MFSAYHQHEVLHHNTSIYHPVMKLISYLSIYLSKQLTSTWWKSHLQNSEYGKHLKDHWNNTQLHHLVNIPLVPIAQLYRHMINSNGPLSPFISTDESIDDTAFLWTLSSHTGIHIMAIGSLIPAGLGIFCFYFFWCQPARLARQHLWSGSLWHTIVDDDVEAAPIYRCNGKAKQPITRPHENHDLCMKWEPTWMESQQKQHAQSKSLPTSRSLDRKSKIQGMQWTHMVCCQT